MMESSRYINRQRNAVLIESGVLAIALYILALQFDDALHFVDLPCPLFDILFSIGVALERMPWLAIIGWLLTTLSVIWLAGNRGASNRLSIAFTVGATGVVAIAGVLVILIGIATVYLSSHPIAFAVIVGLVIAFAVGRWSMAQPRR